MENLNILEIPNYLDLLDKNSLKGVTLGVPQGKFIEEYDDTLEVFNEAIKDLEKLGANKWIAP